MYKDALVMPHHAKYWGANFQWDDFIPMFKAEHFDSEALLSLFQGAGAKYLITMSNIMTAWPGGIRSGPGGTPFRWDQRRIC